MMIKTTRSLDTDHPSTVGTPIMSVQQTLKVNFALMLTKYTTNYLPNEIVE